METLVDEGLAKSIGVSNYSAPLMMDLERYARIMPATLQIEHHPYLRQKCKFWLRFVSQCAHLVPVLTILLFFQLLLWFFYSAR